MSLADFANRKYDLLALQNANPAKETKLGLVLYDTDNSGRACVGIQKLAQRWALEFLTAKGSMPGLPDRGSSFMVLLNQNQLRTQLDVTQSFNASNLRLRVTLQEEEYDSMPDDERFEDAELVSVSILPGYLSLRVLITSRAGDARELILPVSTLPQV